MQERHAKVLGALQERRASLPGAILARTAQPANAKILTIFYLLRGTHKLSLFPSPHLPINTPISQKNTRYNHYNPLHSLHLPQILLPFHSIFYPYRTHYQISPLNSPPLNSPPLSTTPRHTHPLKRDTPPSFFFSFFKKKLDIVMDSKGKKVDSGSGTKSIRKGVATISSNLEEPIYHPKILVRRRLCTKSWIVATPHNNPST